MECTFDYIRNNGFLLFEYIRGSKLYHTDTPESDEDHGGVFITPTDFDFTYCDEIKDKKNDIRWWEFGKFMKLASESEPGALEALFIPDDKVIYEHPLFRHIREHRDEFVTKECFKRFGSYSVGQIKKAKGQNKKIHWDEEDMKRKSPLEFCYTYDGHQGSIKIEDFIAKNGLRQDCFGQTKIPNMRDNFLSYYDFAQHFRLAKTSVDNERENKTPFYKFMRKHFKKEYEETVIKKFEVMSEFMHFDENISKKTKFDENDIVKYIKERTRVPLGGHHGIINNDGTSNTIRTCSVKKDETPILILSYNKDAYEVHCKTYKEFIDWKENRNQERYESNMDGERSSNPDMKYDVKNMYHSLRNVAMCTEIAQGKGILLDRTNIDRDFLMNVRHRKYGYSELIKILEEKKNLMDIAISESTILESVDKEYVKEITSSFRKDFYSQYC